MQYKENRSVNVFNVLNNTFFESRYKIKKTTNLWKFKCRVYKYMYIHLYVCKLQEKREKYS